jgi:pteridine reductase
MQMDLQGQTALVTGAALRIGREISRALAMEGANVVIHYRNSVEKAEELSRELKDIGVRSWLMKADFDKPDEYKDFISRVIEIAGSLDILINSASNFEPSKLEDVGIETVMRDIRVNAWAPFDLCRQFVSQAERGKIINLLDTRIKGYDKHHVAYILSKHLLFDVTRIIAAEFAPSFTVNAVAPGLILPPPGKDQSYLERLAQTVPLKKYGSPKDIADAIIYLLKSDFVTGQTIYVDGGRHIKEDGDGPHSD